MACQPSSQGWIVHYREWRAYGYRHSTAWGNREPQDTLVGTQGLPRFSSARHRLYHDERWHVIWFRTQPLQYSQHGDATRRTYASPGNSKIEILSLHASTILISAWSRWAESSTIFLSFSSTTKLFCFTARIGRWGGFFLPGFRYLFDKDFFLAVTLFPQHESGMGRC